MRASEGVGGARRAERFANLLLGVSFPALGVVHLIRVGPSQRASPVVLTMLVLSLSVGVLFLRRSDVHREPTWRLVLLALPALGVPVWAQAASSPLAGWPLHAELSFAVGGALTAVALLVLGRSFAILPAVRRIVTKGPYRVIRHPAYAGELIMVASCLLARPGWSTVAALVAGLPLVGLRIAAEERLLRSEAGHDEYTKRVRWRLLPLVW